MKYQMLKRMIEWIKKHKVIFALIIIVILAVVGGLVYWFVLKDKLGGNDDHNSQDVIDVGTPVPVESVPQRLSPLPMATSTVPPRQIRKMPRPSLSSGNDSDMSKQDLRNPGVVADQLQQHDDGGQMTIPPTTGGNGGGLDDLFATDSIPQDMEYPEVEVRN